MAPGQVTTGLSAAEYAGRRARLAAQLPPNSVFILPSSPQRFSSYNIPFAYRQYTELLYLTGYNQVRHTPLTLQTRVTNAKPLCSYGLM